MFYSQFILAKKGPLGTIWIAAHLERKLRKNQVADTDIGVSVDSILFPEVPIALRLSSHLLLGVVRIYSRKVNYLFDDCSEALLKIKQAFRSTAVDLPPEQSTAPYHSITLPETFDLDDFELPDSALFHGNFVDHHISTRDQITLQDTMDGMVYSTSQFGLDERFGDGDASHIGLDLDEELLLDKTSTPGNPSVPFGSKDEVDPQTSMQQVGEMDVDGNEDSQAMPELSGDCGRQVDSTTEYSSKAIESPDLHGDDVQTPDLNEGFPPEPIVGPDVMDIEKCDVDQAQVPSLELPESAQAPSTPLLTEEALPANVQGTSTLLRKDPLDHDAESLTPDVSGSSTIEPVDPLLTTKPLSIEKPVQNAEIDAAKNLPLESGEEMTMISQDGDLCVQNPPIDEAPNNAENVVRVADLGSTDQSDHENVERRDCSVVNIVSNNSREVGLTIEPIKEAENIVIATGDDCCSPIASTANLDVPQMPDTIQAGISAYANESNEHMTDLASNNVQSEASKWPTSSNIPEPEKFVLAPSGNSDLPSTFELETAEKEADIEGGGDLDISRSLSRKRHRLLDSSPVEQNGDSSGVLRSKTSTDYMPDDDDILATILVGRKTPVLKMRSTQEAATSKRRRLTSRVSATKRKVLSDDTLVLHGDVIRQQLTNTEDIRRIRRKAPCTRLDIWMIQKYLLEEEIFSEPLFTGMSLELTESLNQTFIEREAGVAYILSNRDGNDGERVHYPNSVIAEENDNEAKEATEAVAQDEKLPSELDIIFRECDPQADFEAPTDVTQVNLSEDGKFQEVAAFEIETENDGTIIGVDMPMMAAAHSKDDYVSVDLGSESPFADAYKEQPAGLMNGPHCLSPEHKSETEPVGEINDTGNGTSFPVESKAIDKDASVVDATGDDTTISTVEVASIAVNASSLGESKGDISADIVQNNHPKDLDDSIKEISDGELVLLVNGSADSGMDVHADSSILSEDVNLSNPDAIERTKDAVVVNAVEDGFPAEWMNGEDIPNTDANCTEWPQLAPCSSQLNMDAEDAPPNEANIGCQPGNDETFCEPDGFDRIWADNDTDFLNADDDVDPADDEDDNEPGAEEHQLYDNSGWSSRTRAVANYLKYLFDGEGGHERKDVPMNNLLAGKTRKEASRMFFETLVLKTKDYIHVEQRKPFENISIQPRGKLMKSEF